MKHFFGPPGWLAPLMAKFGNHVLPCSWLLILLCVVYSSKCSKGRLWLAGCLSSSLLTNQGCSLSKYILFSIFVQQEWWSCNYHLVCMCCGVKVVTTFQVSGRTWEFYYQSSMIQFWSLAKSIKNVVINNKFLSDCQLDNHLLLDPYSSYLTCWPQWGCVCVTMMEGRDQ